MSLFACRAALAAAFLVLPHAALAQDAQLERFEVMSERMTELTYAGIAAQYSVPPEAFPDVAWDRPMRRAGRCILRAYREELGAEGLAQFLDGFEVALVTAEPAALLDGSFQAAVPGGLSTQRQQQIQTECGMLELEMTRLAGSGVLQALQAQ